MSVPQNFRSAFNGFNREDVAHYLEYVHTKHNNQINMLTSENEELRRQIDCCARDDRQELVDSLQARCEDLAAQLEAALARCTELEQQMEEKQTAPAPQEGLSPCAAEELETYRRAERIEREARERAELVYFQANGVLTEASEKVDTIAADITDMADQVMSQLTQLQMAVSSSKQALQDAASIMNTIRPNK
ncbi:MAG: hypothetical protein IJO21_01185 [Oscillospiraceae bacterium]|nr:hypothetical protein [Oscillospiraceae bacterium]MBQ7129645.1 hypothetical protein [Oscillospiraceae bacterium]